MNNSFYLQVRQRRAFSLVEVVVAVGVFAIAIVSVIGIMAGVGRSVGEVTDADKASRLVGVVQARLQDAGFSSIKSAIDANTVLYASEDGSIVGLTGDSAWGGANALKYFELNLIRNTALSDSANDDSAGFLAFNIRIRWPAYLPDGTELQDDTQKSVIIVPAAVTR